MKAFFILFMSAVCSFTLFSQSSSLTKLLNHLDETDRANLFKNGSINHISVEPPNRTLKLLPFHQNTEEVREYIKETNPGVVYEVLFFISNKELETSIANFKREQYIIVDDPTRIRSQQSIVMTHYYNVLRDIESFGSIKYQNLENKNIHPLFNNSQRLQKRDVHSDIVPSLDAIRMLQESATVDSMFILQDMPPFGNVRSEYTYMYNKNQLSFVGTNLSYIKYKGFIVVRPNDMYLSSQIFRTSKGILAYGLGTVKISGLGVLFQSIVGNSFSSRMVGFFRWFDDQ